MVFNNKTGHLALGAYPKTNKLQMLLVNQRFAKISAAVLFPVYGPGWRNLQKVYILFVFP